MALAPSFPTPIVRSRGPDLSEDIAKNPMAGRSAPRPAVPNRPGRRTKCSYAVDTRDARSLSAAASSDIRRSNAVDQPGAWGSSAPPVLACRVEQFAAGDVNTGHSLRKGNPAAPPPSFLDLLANGPDRRGCAHGFRSGQSDRGCFSRLARVLSTRPTYGLVHQAVGCSSVILASATMLASATSAIVVDRGQYLRGRGCRIALLGRVEELLDVGHVA